MNIGVTVGGYVASVILLGLWIDAERDHAAEIEKCNTKIEAAARERERLAREAERDAARDEIAKLNRIAASQAKAREIVTAALREAENRAPVVRTVIREVPRETEAAACLDLAMPAAVLDSVRD